MTLQILQYSTINAQRKQIEQKSQVTYHYFIFCISRLTLNKLHRHRIMMQQITHRTI